LGRRFTDVWFSTGIHPAFHFCLPIPDKMFQCLVARSRFAGRFRFLHHFFLVGRLSGLLAAQVLRAIHGGSRSGVIILFHNAFLSLSIPSTLLRVTAFPSATGTIVHPRTGVWY